MKISKVITGLIVCGALVFPGALNSSAQEINPSASPESINYSTNQETKLLTNIAAVSEPFKVGISLKYYEGDTYNHTMYKNGKKYVGTLYYVSKDSKGFNYTGWMEEYKGW